ncbi:hypothetical protein C483_05598 [Natrialba hulunbeirensis JCM 10989]|uniref:DUF8107 domain-containing protein n=1 Tax=Natrialba hulunbeirensis JCM 10989 TaxID=1227493 RepID=M0A3S6_9EURY|nr:hypothetical protein [Natrialba hulunbeirensis]ELY93415.1 hypothetical protein C483_05598 [Natrialba hulunbeirensis JCM 10989]
MAGDSGTDGDRGGFREGLESSAGDPRLLIVLNAILSALFAWWLVWGAALVGALEYSLATVAVVAVGLFLLTHVMTRPS